MIYLSSISGSFEHLETNQSHAFHSSQFPSSSSIVVLYSQLANMTTMSNTTSTKTTFYKLSWLQTLCTLKTMKFLKSDPLVHFLGIQNNIHIESSTFDIQNIKL